MPIYEYQCARCGHKLEAIQKMSDDPLTDCPACGEPHLQKLISAVGFRLKGGGWYETDFKSGNKRNLAGTEGAGDGGGSGGKAGEKSSEKTSDKSGESSSGSSASSSGESSAAKSGTSTGTDS